MKKFLLLVVLLCPLTGLAQSTAGYHRVGQVLARAPQTVNAQVVPYASVSVSVTSTGAAAVIYSDPGLSVQITPPLVRANDKGTYDYYIALNYMVTETISSPGQGLQVISNVGENASGGTVTAAFIATTIQTQTGCSTAGYVWVPASNTCVAQTGGGGTFTWPSAIPSGTTIPYGQVTSQPTIPTSANWPGTVTCTNQFVSSIANGSTPTCSTVNYSQLGGTVPTWNQSTTGNAATASNASQLLGSTWASPPLAGYGSTTPEPVNATAVTSQSVNGMMNVASLLWGTGDIQTRLAAAQATVGNLDFYIPSSGGYPNCYSYANPIVFTGATLRGAGRWYGTCLKYTGTGVAFTAGNWQDISGFNLMGPGVANAGNAQTGILVSGAYSHIHDVTVQGFALGMTWGNNSYLNRLSHSNLQYNTQNLLYPGGLTDSGENIEFDHVTFGNCGTFANGVQFGVQGSVGPEINLIASSFDGCQLVNNEGIMRGTGLHFEDIGTISNPFFVGYDSALNGSTGQSYTRFADVSVVNDHADTANGAFEVDRYASLSIDGLADYSSVGSLFYMNTGSGGVPYLNFKAPTSAKASSAIYNIASGTSPMMNVETLKVHLHSVNGNEVWTQNNPSTSSYLKSGTMAFNGGLDLGGWNGNNPPYNNYFSGAIKPDSVGGIDICYNTAFVLTDPDTFGTESLTCPISLTQTGLKFGSNIVLPSPLTGYHGNSAGTKVQLSDGTGTSVPAAFDANGNLTAGTAILSTTTGSIGGSLLSLGCTSEGTVTVTGAATSMACLMSGVGGNPANVQPQCSVTAPNTVTVQFCTAVAVTPASQTYAIRVF